MKYHLFEVFGIELEYMLVDSSTGRIKPAVDELMKLKTGQLVSDVDNGTIEWSNEDLNQLDLEFHKNILEINKLLKLKEMVLWPTACHPLMNPDLEMKLWEHSYSDVYALYNRIFDCKGHGWSNVQSMHINLPFYDDLEFEKLHAAVRLILPILPALSASSPILNGKNTGFKDARMKMYLTNQQQIPEMTGKVIPEQVFTQHDYQIKIFDPINTAIAPYDKENILEHNFLNSRGAIARFDRNAIEIRILDLQECPLADISISSFIVEVLKELVDQVYSNLSVQKSWHENDLFDILETTICQAEGATVINEKYLKVLGINSESMQVSSIWTHLFERVSHRMDKRHQDAIGLILAEGSLSTRTLKAIQDDYSETNILRVYKQLENCLSTNQLFRS
jgi:hypothetical protein